MGNFEKLRSLLKKKYPDYNVKIRRVKLNHYGTWQTIDQKKKEFLIKIDSKSSTDNQCDALIHEFSHILQVEKTFENENQHNDAWGKTYAKLYRIYEDEIIKYADE